MPYPGSRAIQPPRTALPAFPSTLWCSRSCTTPSWTCSNQEAGPSASALLQPWPRSQLQSTDAWPFPDHSLQPCTVTPLSRHCSFCSVHATVTPWRVSWGPGNFLKKWLEPMCDVCSPQSPGSGGCWWLTRETEETLSFCTSLCSQPLLVSGCPALWMQSFSQWCMPVGHPDSITWNVSQLRTSSIQYRI